MKSAKLVVALLFLIHFVTTLYWWSDYHLGTTGTLAGTAFGIFVLVGLPSGLVSALMLWRWARS